MAILLYKEICKFILSKPLSNIIYFWVVYILVKKFFQVGNLNWKSFDQRNVKTFSSLYISKIMFSWLILDYYKCVWLSAS